MKLHRFHAAPASTRVDFGHPINLTWRANGGPRAPVDGGFDLKVETARRLAVCWNVCEGIPTDVLERGHLREMVAAIDSGDLDEARRLLRSLDRAIDYTNDRLNDCPNPDCRTTYERRTTTTKSPRRTKMITKNETAKTETETEPTTLKTGETAPAAKAAKKAFDFERSSLYVADPLELCIVGGLDMPPGERGPLDTDNDNLSHPLYDERVDLPLTEEMIANVNAYGVLAPISIAKIDGVACVVDGRQRVRAARVVNARRKKAGEPLLKVKCDVQRTQDSRLLGVMIAGNEARTNDDQSTKLAKLKRLMERGVSVADAAITFRISESTLKAWLKFDDQATEALKLAVDDGKIPHSAGLVLARMKDPEKQNEALRELLANADTEAATGAKRGAKKSGVAAAKKAAKKAKNADSSGGLSNRRTQRKLLEVVEKKEHSRASEKSLAWWEGVEAALRLVTGDGKVDERLASILKEVE